MRILAVDIETCPNLVYVWGLWDQNISLSEMVESTEMLCWAAKWLDEEGIEFRSVFHDGRRKMVRRIWKLLDEADVVLHFNGRHFDVPHIQREFLEAGMLPTAPFKQIDLLETVRKQFRFPSNKLAYVSKRLGLEGKVEHEGFGLWLKCMADDPDAWERMKAYNVQDVLLLERMYEKLQPWIPSHPSYASEAGENICPKCGSKKLRAHGTTFLSTGKYQRYVCGHCGGWSRGTKRIDHTEVAQIAA